jgi:DNA-directed RNA polymerase subunit RPC12/RpoP
VYQCDVAFHAMKCPACSSRIVDDRYDGALPREGIVYRCAICRLELVYDPQLDKMRLSPFPLDSGETKKAAAR